MGTRKHTCSDAIHRDEIQPSDDDVVTKNAMWQWLPKCPDCGETQPGQFSAILGIGFGNVSLTLRCQNCGFKHKDRDWRNSNNLKRHLCVRRFLKPTYWWRYPAASPTVHSIATCPFCNGDDVRVELQRKRVQEAESTSFMAVLRFLCRTCENTYVNTTG